MGYTFYCNKIKLQNCFIIIHYDLMQFFNQTIQPHTNNYEENNHTNNLIIIIIIIRTFVTRAVSANILNLRLRYCPGAVTEIQNNNNHKTVVLW